MVNISMEVWMQATKETVFKSGPSKKIQKYSRVGQAKLFKGCHPQILIGPLLNTLPQRKQSYHAPFFRDRESLEKLYFQGKSGNLKVAVTRKQSTPNFPKNEHF